MKKQALYMDKMPINKGIEGNHVGMYRENENIQWRKFICSENGYYHLTKQHVWCYQKCEGIAKNDKFPKSTKKEISGQIFIDRFLKISFELLEHSYNNLR